MNDAEKLKDVIESAKVPRRRRVIAIEPDLEVINALMKFEEIVPFAEARGESVFDTLLLMDILCNRPFDYHVLFDTSTFEDSDKLPEATLMRDILWKAVAIVHSCNLTRRQENALGKVSRITILSDAGLFYKDPVNNDVPLSMFPPLDIFNTRQSCHLKATQVMEAFVIDEWGRRNANCVPVHILRVGPRVIEKQEDENLPTPWLETTYAELASWIADGKIREPSVMVRGTESEEATVSISTVSPSELHDEIGTAMEVGVDKILRKPKKED